MTDSWAKRWSIPNAAIEDLVSALAPMNRPMPGNSEAAVQQRVRLKAAKAGWRLWRNNVGAATDARGNFLRYGLANDSAGLNKLFKSSDLIGIKSVLITEEHVGTTIGQFISIEVKRGDWKRGSSQREIAQARWLEMVASHGGLAGFSVGELPDE